MTVVRAKLSVAPLAAALAFLIPQGAHARPEIVPTVATAYTPCSSGTITADGTRTRPRVAAANHLPLGTRIRLVGRPFLRGMRRFTVHDRGGMPSGHLDLWTGSCSAGVWWGRRSVRYKIGWGKP